MVGYLRDITWRSSTEEIVITITTAPKLRLLYLPLLLLLLFSRVSLSCAFRNARGGCGIACATGVCCASTDTRADSVRRPPCETNHRIRRGQERDATVVRFAVLRGCGHGWARADDVGRLQDRNATRRRDDSSERTLLTCWGVYRGSSYSLGVFNKKKVARFSVYKILTPG